MAHCLCQHPSQHPLAERCAHFLAISPRHQPTLRILAVLLAHHDILRHVDQTPRQVARRRRPQRRIRHPLAGAVR